MNLPITSRLKRVSILKQTNPKAKVSGSIEGNSTTVSTPKRTLREAYALRGEEYKDLNFGDYSKVAKESELYGTSGGTKIIPEGDLDYSAVEQKATKGTVFKPTEVRKLSRAVKKSGRDVSRAEKKISKYATSSKDDKGNIVWTPKAGLSEKQKIKFRENKAELEGFKDIAANVRKGAKSGKGFGGTFISGQRDVLLGEKTPEQQKVIARNEAKKKQKVATEKKLTTAGRFKQSSGSINPEGDSSDGGFDYERFTGDTGMGEAIRSATAPRALGDTNTVKKPSISNMKEKSIAYKTLKGGQNKLPKQLQDAIKAAPGKMKSSFKMKGYGKK